MTTQVAIIDKKVLAKFDITPAQVAAKVKEYDCLKVVEADTKSYKDVRAACTMVVRIRAGVDDRRLELNADDQKKIKNRNKAAKELVAPLAPLEARFKTEMKTEDDRKQAIKDEKARVEKERVNYIHRQIVNIQGYATVLPATESTEIKRRISYVATLDIGEDEYMESFLEAREAQEATYASLQTAFKARLKWEEEEGARKAESERLEKIRLEQEAKEKALAEAQKKIDDEKAKIEADKKAVSDRKEREAREAKIREEAKAQAEKDAKAKTEQVEKDRIANEKAEEEEKARQEALRPDKEKLMLWVEWFKPNVPRPELQSEEAQTILYDGLHALDSWLMDIRKRGEAL